MKDSYFFYYKLRHWVDSHPIVSEGFSHGATWQDVINRLTKYYGESHIDTIQCITQISSEACGCVDLKELKKALDYNPDISCKIEAKV